MKIIREFRFLVQQTGHSHYQEEAGNELGTSSKSENDNSYENNDDNLSDEADYENDIGIMKRIDIITPIKNINKDLVLSELHNTTYVRGDVSGGHTDIVDADPMNNAGLYIDMAIPTRPGNNQNKPNIQEFSSHTSGPLSPAIKTTIHRQGELKSRPIPTMPRRQISAKDLKETSFAPLNKTQSLPLHTGSHNTNKGQHPTASLKPINSTLQALGDVKQTVQPGTEQEHITSRRVATCTEKQVVCRVRPSTKAKSLEIEDKHIERPNLNSSVSVDETNEHVIVNKSLEELSVPELVQFLDSYKLTKLADVCKTHLIDGSNLCESDDIELRDEPFNLSSFDLRQFKRIKAGQLPKL